MFKFKRNKKIEKLDESINRLLHLIEKSKYIQIINLLGNKREILKRNIIGGIGKGIGIGIGFTIISAIIIVLLQKIVALNIPIIGEYISDIVEVVENNR